MSARSATPVRGVVVALLLTTLAAYGESATRAPSPPPVPAVGTPGRTPDPASPTPATAGAVRGSASVGTPGGKPSPDGRAPASFAKPPPGKLTYGERTQHGGLGSFCWWSAGCGDAIGLPVAAEPLPVPGGGVLAFTLDDGTPTTALTAEAFPLIDTAELRRVDGRLWAPPPASAGSAGQAPPPQALPTTVAGPVATLSAPASPGSYVILVNVGVDRQGEASYAFHLVVR